MNLLVTGGAGFIGSHFVKKQVETNAWNKIFVLDSLTYAGNLSNLASIKEHKSINFVKADINEEDVVNEL